MFWRMILPLRGAMDHISADLWDDPRFVMCAVKRAPGALEHAQPEIKASLWAEKYGGVVNLRPPQIILELKPFQYRFSDRPF